MRVLIVGTNTDGVFYHRLFTPYNNIANTTNITFFNAPQIDTATFEELKDFDAVIFNRNISQKMNPQPIFYKLKLAKVKIIIDVDDYWEISPGHPMYHYSRKTNFAKCCIDQLKNADYITTTHAHLRNEVIKLGVDGTKVIICRNAIDISEPQYNQEFTYSDKLMWQGSSTHAMDLELLSEIEQPITLCGYHYSEEWFDMCSKIKDVRKRDSLPVYEYMNFYNDSGIALIPLRNNKFNGYKSELKMIEAGWAKKPVIVSSVHPYTLLAKHGINSLTAKDSFEFKKYVNLLLSNQQLQEDLRGNLHEEIKQRYMIEKVNERRLDILKKCQR
jgi:glycosyltransferase involved in cell wall biosynthesis